MLVLSSDIFCYLMNYVFECTHYENSNKNLNIYLEFFTFRRLLFTLNKLMWLNNHIITNTIIMYEYLNTFFVLQLMKITITFLKIYF